MGRGPTEDYYQTLHDDYVKGTLTCLKPETIKARANTRFPLVLNIEPTNLCDLKCFYCPREQAKKGFGKMSFDFFRRLIDEAAGYGPLTMLNLHKDGESFLHPDFLKMVRYAKDKKVADVIHVNTNAVCWNERMISDILDSGLDDITVSLDAARPQTYRDHKGKDQLRLVENNVRTLIQQRKRRGLKRPFLRVKIMEFDKISKEELDEFFKKWSDEADLVQVTGCHSWSGEIKDLKVTDEQSPQRYPCVILWYALVVNWNGEVTVCSVDWNTHIKVGDAHQETLHDIWNSPSLKQARLAQFKKDFTEYPVCKECIVWVSSGDMSEWLKEHKEFYEL